MVLCVVWGCLLNDVGGVDGGVLLLYVVFDLCCVKEWYGKWLYYYGYGEMLFWEDLISVFMEVDVLM